MAKSVLIADDEANISLAIQFLMKRAGYDVRVAADGEEALEAVRRSPPDLIVLDVMMPKRDGYDVCQTIRSDPSLKGVKIMMVSAKGGPIEVEKGKALGADDYMVKPFSTQELAARVRDLLNDDAA
jgi:two-component system alkaline phosphatase synthesis response regulator PhoP